MNQYKLMKLNIHIIHFFISDVYVFNSSKLFRDMICCSDIHTESKIYNHIETKIKKFKICGNILINMQLATSLTHWS